MSSESALRRGGRRPPRLEDDNVQTLLKALAQGHYMERACRLAGISRDSVYRWIANGRDERRRQEEGLVPSKKGQPYLEILQEIEKHKEYAAHRALRTITNAFDNHWQAAAWYLERTDPEHFGRRNIIVGADQGPVNVIVSAEDLDRQLANMIAASRASEIDNGIAERSADA